jgi:DNA ligase-associated metallophosphoesterase
MFTHELKGEELKLLPEKAIYWPSQKTLLLADAHLGKIRHFRKSGIAIPGKAGYRNLLHLQNMLSAFKPDRVIFLGDLFHSEMNFEWLEFKALLDKFKELSFVLIQGNHDILHEQSYSQFEVIYTPLELGPFILSHEPLEKDQKLYNLCGHIHPGVRMLGQARQSMRLPCFYFGASQGILPAFGIFTGLHLVKPEKNDKIFVIAGSQVYPAT